MTVRYSDTAGSNTSPYDTWAKAATDPQTIFDLATAGDFNYYRGSKTLTVPIDVDTYSGDITNGFIKHIGCAADGSIDGTKYVLNGNTAAANCIKGGGTSEYHWFENFELKNATGHGLYANSLLDKSVYLNCLFHNNDSDGYYGYAAYGCTFILCKFYGNTGSGCNVPAAPYRFIFCSLHNNSDHGLHGHSTGDHLLLYGCLIHNNTVAGIGRCDDYATIISCVLDGTVIGMTFSDWSLLIGNRITNNTTGLACGSYMGICGWNYFHDNTADVSNATLAYNIPYREALTNHLMSAGIDGTNKVDVDADDGYNTRANDDFNLKASRTLIRTEIDLEIGT